MPLERFHYRAWKWAIQRLTRPSSRGQLSKFETEEWDIAIVLDACRADILQEVADWPIETTRSPASCTPEWLGRIADSGTFQEYHVVTGNPQYEKVPPGAKSVEAYWNSHWDDRLQTTPPEPILNRVTELATAGESPIVAHLMQPHWPYLSRVGDSWRLAYDNLRPWQSDNGEIDSIQVAMQRGFIDTEVAEKAYRAAVASIWQTLLPYIEQWSEESTVVVTSDHGETFGRLSDFGFYEHPWGCHVRPLTEVPWVTFAPKADSRESAETTDEQLAALGYK